MKSKLFTHILAALLAVGVLAFVPLMAAIDSPTSITFGLRVKETTTTDLGSGTWLYSADWAKTFANGTGINQVNKVFQDSATLAGSGTLSIDLDSTLTGPLGSVSFTRIAAICARRTDTPVASTQDENVTISGDFILTKYLIPGADVLAATTMPLQPGGVWCFVAPDATGVAITATTGDVLLFTNASAADSTTLQLLILGS